MPSQGCSDGPPRLAAAGSNRHRHIFRSPGRPPGPYRQLLWRLRPLPPYRLRQEFKDRVKPPLPSCEKAPPAANQKSTGKAAFYGPCKIRDAGRRPNRPTGGFSGLRPLARLRRAACGPFSPAEQSEKRKKAHPPHHGVRCAFALHYKLSGSMPNLSRKKCRYSG